MGNFNNYFKPNQEIRRDDYNKRNLINAKNKNRNISEGFKNKMNLILNFLEDKNKNSFQKEGFSLKKANEAIKKENESFIAELEAYVFQLKMISESLELEEDDENYGYKKIDLLLQKIKEYKNKYSKLMEDASRQFNNRVDNGNKEFLVLCGKVAIEKRLNKLLNEEKSLLLNLKDSINNLFEKSKLLEEDPEKFVDGSAADNFFMAEDDEDENENSKEEYLFKKMKKTKIEGVYSAKKLMYETFHEILENYIENYANGKDKEDEILLEMLKEKNINVDSYNFQNTFNNLEKRNAKLNQDFEDIFKVIEKNLNAIDEKANSNIWDGEFLSEFYEKFKMKEIISLMESFVNDYKQVKLSVDYEIVSLKEKVNEIDEIRFLKNYEQNIEFKQNFKEKLFALKEELKKLLEQYELNRSFVNNEKEKTNEKEIFINLYENVEKILKNVYEKYKKDFSTIEKANIKLRKLNYDKNLKEFEDLMKANENNIKKEMPQKLQQKEQEMNYQKNIKEFENLKKKLKEKIKKIIYSKSIINKTVKSLNFNETNDGERLDVEKIEKEMKDAFINYEDYRKKLCKTLGDLISLKEKNKDEKFKSRLFSKVLLKLEDVYEVLKEHAENLNILNAKIKVLNTQIDDKQKLLRDGMENYELIKIFDYVNNKQKLIKKIIFKTYERETILLERAKKTPLKQILKEIENKKAEEKREEELNVKKFNNYKKLYPKIISNFKKEFEQLKEFLTKKLKKYFDEKKIAVITYEGKEYDFKNCICTIDKILKDYEILNNYIFKNPKMNLNLAKKVFKNFTDILAELKKLNEFLIGVKEDVKKQKNEFSNKDIENKKNKIIQQFLQKIKACKKIYYETRNEIDPQWRLEKIKKQINLQKNLDKKQKI